MKNPVKPFHATALLLAASAFFAGAAHAQVPTAQPPSMLWQETFDNSPTSTTPIPLEADNTGTLGLTVGYQGLYGETYTADPDWLPNGAIAGATVSSCDGWVLNNSNATFPATDTSCAGTSAGRYVAFGDASSPSATTTYAWTYLRRMAMVLGMAQGGALNNNNNAVASMTNGGATQSDSLQLSIPDVSTLSHTVTPVAGHFYVASALFAAVHCSADKTPAGVAAGTTWYNPWENVNLVVNGTMQGTLQDVSTVCPTTPPPTGSLTYTGLPASPPTYPVTGYYPYQDTPTTSEGLTVGNIAGDVFVAQVYSQAYLATGTETLGLQINNTQVQSTANDVAFDTPTIADATPQLYKSFDPTDPADYLDGSIATGGTGTLTFIVVNTTDDVDKAGWSFTDTLPTGVSVASTPNVTLTNCGTMATTDVSASGQTIAVTSGDLPGATCTISVNVTSTTAGVYPNSVDSNVTMNGLVVDPSAQPATLYVDQLTLKKTAQVTDGTTHAAKSAVTTAGDVITYTFTLTNNDPPTTGGELLLNTLNLNDPQPPVAGIGFGGSSPLTVTSCKIGSTTVTLPVTDDSTLAGGQSLVCTATYTVTQGDIDTAIAGTGKINNTATAGGTAYPPGETDPSTGTALTTQPNSVDVTVTPNPALKISKTASPTVMTAAGNTIAYTITLTNTGNETMSGLTLTDNFSGKGTNPTSALIANCTSSGGGAAAALSTISLAPGQTATCTANYTVVAGDLTAGTITNTASAVGTDRTRTSIPTSTMTATVLSPSAMSARIPTLDARALALLALTLAALAFATLRRSRKQP